MVAALALSGVCAASQAPAQESRPGAAFPAVLVPPLGERLDYRVTSRRFGRDGTLIEFVLHYDLVWQPAGRGFELKARLTRITSDAPLAVRRVTTGLMAPLIGVAVNYLVSADGSRIDLVDADHVWALAVPGAARLGQTTPQDEANAMAAVLMTLPLAERNQLLTADVRALVAQANPAIPRTAAGGPPGSAISIRAQGKYTVIAKHDTATALAASGPVGALPLTIVSTWTIDDGTGLVTRAVVQTWVKGSGDAPPTLVEEHIGALIPVAP